MTRTVGARGRAGEGWRRRTAPAWPLLAVVAGVASMAGSEPAVTLEPVAPDSPVWRELAAEFARQPEVTAPYQESRLFPYRREPVVLQGEVRVSRLHGLSLHYTAPEERIVVVDDKGMLVRDRNGESTGPADARASAANEAMLAILRLDLSELAKAYDVRGWRQDGAWSLLLVPRSESVRRAIGDIHVDGNHGAVRRIELRRSARQRIEIVMSEPRRGAFSPEELRRFFR